MDDEVYDLRVSAVQVLGPQQDLTSLTYLQSIYRDTSLPLPVRMRAALGALPFENPRLAVVANINNHEMGSKLEARIAQYRLGRD